MITVFKTIPIVFLCSIAYLTISLSQSFIPEKINSSEEFTCISGKLEFHPSGKMIINGGEGFGRLHIWDVSTAIEVKAIGKLIPENLGDLFDFALSRDGKFLGEIKNFEFSHIHIWDFEKGELVTDIPFGGYNIAFMPKGDYFVTNREIGPDWVYSFRESGNGDEKREIFDPNISKKDWRSCYMMEISPDGKILSTISQDNLCFFDIEKEQKFNWFNNVFQYRFTHDWSKIAMLDTSSGLRVEDFNTLHVLYTFPWKNAHVHGMDFSPDGKIFAFATDSIAYFVTTDSWSVIALLHDPDRVLRTVRFSPDGKMIAVISSRQRPGGYDLVSSLSFWKLVPYADKISQYVQSQFDKWKVKDEFEKSDDYKKRMEQAPAMMNTLFTDAFSQFKLGENTTLSAYDADHESYKLAIPVIGDVVVPVGIASAKMFKEHWGQMNFTPEFARKDTGWYLDRLVITDTGSKQQFAYTSGSQAGYNPTMFNVSTGPIQIVKSTEGESSSPVYAISADSSDVDNRIPTNGKNDPNAIAIILGVEQYKNVSAVPYARRDASTFKEYAVRLLGVPDDNLHLYFRTDADVTKGELEKLFMENGWLAKHCTANTDVFIYYAGHGAPNMSDQSPYLIPNDGDPNYPNQTGFGLGVLYEELGKLNARSVTIFLDACFSGITRDNKPLLADARPINITVTDPALLSDKIVTFSASGGNQIGSSFPGKEHGLFTFYLLKGLRGDADANGDNVLTVEELEKYLQEQVPREAGRMDREQNPQVRGKNKQRALIRY